MIEVTFEDLSKLDWMVLELLLKCEMEEWKAARLWNKLACFQKTSGMVKKMDMARWSRRMPPSTRGQHQGLLLTKSCI
jgi:hypothetical protein